MKISTKLKFAAWVPGLMTFLVVGTLIVSFIELQQIQNEGSAVMDIRTHITELNHLVFNYIQYHDERPRQQFAGYHRDLTELIAGARVRGSDQQALLDTIRDNNEAMDQLFNQLVASFEYPASDPVQIQETESRLVGLLLQKSYEADISAAKLRRLVDAGIRRNEIITLGFILVIVLIATVPLSYILNRTRLGITTDLKRLNKGAAVIGSGNLDFQIDETNPDEIGELSRDFNRMTSALRSITASKQELEKEIAERKRLEAARFEAEERLRFALDSSQTGAWDLDLIDHTAFRSLEHDRIFGYTELLPNGPMRYFSSMLCRKTGRQ